MRIYIDQDTLLNKMQERYEDIAKDYGDYDNYVMGFRDAIEFLENAPVADVQEAKHGKWLPYRFGLEVTKCSICKAVYEGGDSFRFCPKCGAKMDGDKPIDGLKGEHK